MNEKRKEKWLHSINSRTNKMKITKSILAVSRVRIDFGGVVSPF